MSREKMSIVCIEKDVEYATSYVSDYVTRYETKNVTILQFDILTTRPWTLLTATTTNTKRSIKKVLEDV